MSQWVDLFTEPSKYKTPLSKIEWKSLEKAETIQVLPKLSKFFWNYPSSRLFFCFSSGIVMQTERAFFSMAHAGDKILAFGGYNNVTGMLKSIETFNGTAWTAESAPIELPTERYRLIRKVPSKQKGII